MNTSGKYPPPTNPNYQNSPPPTKNSQYPPTQPPSQQQFPPTQPTSQYPPTQPPSQQYPPQQYPPQQYPPQQYPPQQYPPQQYPSQQYPPQQFQSQYPPPQYGQQYPPQQYPSQYPPQYPPSQQYPTPGQQYPPGPQQGPKILQQSGQWFTPIYQSITPQEMSQIQAWFGAADRDRSGTVSAMELANLSVGNFPLGFETAAVLIKIFDKDNNGTLDFTEFATLHKFMNKMYGAFLAADQDRSGYLDNREIHNALTNAGFQLSMPTIDAVMQKSGAVPGRGIAFPGFLKICGHLSAVRSIFEWNDVQKTGRVTLTYDQLSHIAIHLLP
eukprot:TRINITY_DN994_c0_g1_i1.p1 TRINITY_DN994_c0_g1~~TRINITY_DN994_c0_g1_i1.p1  ORF type:complete len:341 (-),score=99.33 TRINITY_DN994_c0_g1_i1:29-1009(-)